MKEIDINKVYNNFYAGVENYFKGFTRVKRMENTVLEYLYSKYCNV